MSNNKHLIGRVKNPNDECYTQYETVEELMVFKDKFKDKTIYCNCDDYRWSNFVKWFKDNFEKLGLKKLVATHYHIKQDFFDTEKPKHYEYDGKSEVITDLQGDGSFDSPECIRILKDCDVIVSNPPFSLIKQYYNILEKYGKDFIFIGPITALTLNPKRFFDNTLQFIRLKNKMFMNNGKLLSVHNTGFYTTFTGIVKRKQFEFAEFDYEKNKIMKVKNECDKYRNKKIYVINCNHSKEIPNYEWLMVPMTFIEKEIPHYMNFEIVCRGILEGQTTFIRLLIHNTHPDALPVVPQLETKPLF